jgi:hypothetical protein
MKRRELVALSTAVLALTPLGELRAQTPPSAPAPATPAVPAAPSPAGSSSTAAASPPPFTAAQIDQMLAPIALYPDALLSQTLMAATYPLEVVEAARWSKDNPTLKGDAAITAVKDKGWDVSVTSLVAFPQVLEMMNSKLDWTQKVGDAMIAQQSDVAASIQRLRKQAQDAGNLKTTPQMKVTTQPPSAGAPADTPAAIVIEPANPQTVYVPAYNPVYTYGPWPYPEYPPVYFPPPPNYGYVPALLGGLAFGVGFGIGFGFFGGWHWGGGWGGGWGWGGWGGWHGGNSYTTINNNVTRINNNYNRDHPNHNGRWNHDPAHRHGVPYRDPGSRQKYGQHHPTAGQRQAFRGRIDHSPRTSGLQGAGREPRTADQNRAAENRAAENRGAQNQRAENHGTENRSHAFSGVNHAQQVNREAARGRAYSANHGGGYHGGYRGGGNRAWHGGGGRGGWGGHGGGGHGGRR